MEEEKIIMKEIDEKIKNLKEKKKEINDKKLRLRSNNRGKSNALIRVSINFQKKIDHINLKRNENGFDCLSGPKITELFIKHKKCFPKIQSDIIHYNTSLDKSEGDFNDK